MLIWMKRYDLIIQINIVSPQPQRRGDGYLSPFSAGNKPRGFTLSVRRSVCSGGPSFFWFLIYLSVCFVCLSLFVCPSCYAFPSLLCIHPSFCPPSVLLLSSFCPPSVLLLSFCPPFVLLSSFCPPSVLLLSSFCPSSVLLLSSFCLCYCPCLWYCLLLLSFLILLCPLSALFVCLSAPSVLLFHSFLSLSPSVRPSVCLFDSQFMAFLILSPFPSPPLLSLFFSFFKDDGPRPATVSVYK